MKILWVGLGVMFLANCTINVNIYDRREERPVGTLSSSPVVATQSKQYAEIYFKTTPPLATVKVISKDEASDLQDETLGDTPLTVRLTPRIKAPFDSGICGEKMTVIFELEGYRTETLAQRISCFSTEAASEANANEFLATLTKITP